MKTQISSLINGCKNVRIEEKHPKYTNAQRSALHTGYAGSCYELRREIAEKVLTENPESMNINCFDRKFLLKRYSSTTGKTNWYETTISPEDFLLLSGYALLPYRGQEQDFHLVITQDMNVQVTSFHRMNNNRQWKQGVWVYIDASFVTIE